MGDLIIPCVKQISKKMKKDTSKLQVYLNGTKNNLNKSISVFWVKFDIDKFLDKLESTSNFFKKISNSKMTITGYGPNRDWWKNLQPNGIYKYKISNNEIEIKFFIETEKPINERELKLRLLKIMTPKEMEFNLNDVDHYINSIPEITEVVKEGMEMFGGVTKNKINELKNFNDSINSN